MSRTTRRFLLRSLALTGVLTAAAWVAPPTVHGQGERALLNRVSAPASTTTAADVSDVPVSGEQALLGRSRASSIANGRHVELPGTEAAAKPVDGALALMGRPGTIEARRSGELKRQ